MSENENDTILKRTNILKKQEIFATLTWAFSSLKIIKVNLTFFKFPDF